LLLFTTIITERLRYIAGFLSLYYSVDVRCTKNKQEFLDYQRPKINYSNSAVCPTEIWIEPQGLLFASGIEPININTFTHAHQYTAFFKNNSRTGFDILSAVFFLLSRYEEYLPHQKDGYGRYHYGQSLASKEGFLHLPLINIWLEDFKQLVNKSFPESALPPTPFLPLFTYDIDMAWSYRNKGFLRNTGGFFKSFLGRDLAAVKERSNVLFRKQKDPFDSFDWLENLHKELGLDPIYFFHVGAKRGRYDKNISPQNTAFRQLVKTLQKGGGIGLHPSWRSGDDPSLIAKEKQVLESIVGKEVNQSRQHYIRFTLPQTYRHLLAAGIVEDYSMGYGSTNGFRASVAAPFYWYDLERETATKLLLYPFCFMDATSFFIGRCTANETAEEMLQYYNTVKEVGGLFIAIWHNNILSTDTLFDGFQEAYEKALKTISVS